MTMTLSQCREPCALRGADGRVPNNITLRLPGGRAHVLRKRVVSAHHIGVDATRDNERVLALEEARSGLQEANGATQIDDREQEHPHLRRAAGWTDSHAFTNCYDRHVRAARLHESQLMCVAH